MAKAATRVRYCGMLSSSRPSAAASAPSIEDRTRSLSPEQEVLAVHRLGNLAVGFGVLFLLVIVLRLVLGKQLELYLPNRGAANLLSAFFAALMFTLLGLSRSRLPPAKILKAGLFIELIISLGLALEEQLMVDFFAGPPRPSFVFIVLLSFPLIVPGHWPRRVITTLLCSLSPVFVLPLSLTLTGRAMPSSVDVVLNTLPMLIAGAVALYGAKLAHQLRREANEARRLGSYELVERLGAGTMGQVWRANHRLLAREAAVKLISADTLNDHGEQANARFTREAHATASLRSPHTVALYDYGITDEGTMYFAMELVPGLTLDQLVRQHGPLSAERSLYLMRQVALSLAEAHRAGLIHRDIKPANIMVSNVGIQFDFVKVLDFGLVKNVNHRQDVTLTQDRAVTGTPAFMAPEVVLEQDIDARADLYSLGCVAYWLMTGQLVFDETTPLKMMMAHANEDPTAPSLRTELELSPEIDELILKCLAKDRYDRFRNAEELIEAIDFALISCETRWEQRDAIQWWSQRPVQGRLL